MWKLLEPITKFEISSCHIGVTSNDPMALCVSHSSQHRSHELFLSLVPTFLVSTIQSEDMNAFLAQKNGFGNPSLILIQAFNFPSIDCNRGREMISHLLRSCLQTSTAHAPVYGTKEQAQKRSLELGEVIREKAALQRSLAAERDAGRQALSQQERSAGEEVDAHKLTLLTSGQNRGANIVRWRKGDKCIIETTCFRNVSEKAVWSKWSTSS